MRVMVVIKANKDTEAGALPDEGLLTEMGKFNEELVKAGMLLAMEGLHPSSKNARVKFSGAKRTVIDGPFIEAKELIAGYWLWQVKSMDEAIDRCSRRRTSAPSSRLSSGSRRSVCSRRWPRSLSRVSACTRG